MNTQEVLALFEQQQRIAIEYPGLQKEVLPHVIRFVKPLPGMSFIEYSRLNDTNADRVIREQIDYFKQLNVSFEWKVFDYDLPHDLGERLLAHGFQPDDEPGDLMALDLQEAPTALMEPIAVDVRCITAPDQLADVIQVEEQVWGRNFDWLRIRLADHLIIPGYLKIYAAYVDGYPACSGWVYCHPNSQFASLWGGSTVPDYRQRGLYTAVLAARVQEAIRCGYRYLTIEAGPMSGPIVAKHGFSVLARVQDYTLSETPHSAPQ